MAKQQAPEDIGELIKYLENRYKIKMKYSKNDNNYTNNPFRKHKDKISYLY